MSSKEYMFPCSSRGKLTLYRCTVPNKRYTCESCKREKGSAYSRMWRRKHKLANPRKDSEVLLAIREARIKNKYRLLRSSATLAKTGYRGRVLFEPGV